MAVESAASAVKSAEKPPNRALPQMIEKLSAARSRLTKISNRRNLIVKFHCQTKSYKSSKTDANNQSILLRWILQQVPLIESELNPKVSSGKVSTGSTSQRRSKRKLIDNENSMPENSMPGAKRQKVGQGARTKHINIYPSTNHETSAQQVMRTGNFHSNSGVLRFDQPLPRTRASELRSDHEKSGTMLDDRRGVFEERFYIQLPRRSSRLKRPPERFQ